MKLLHAILPSMPFPGEVAFLHQIQSMALSSPTATAGAVFLARYLIFLDLILLGILVAQDKKGRHVAAEAIWAGGVAILITTLISGVLQRPRPFTVLENELQHLVPIPWNTSFPSGHTSVSFAVAFILMSYNRTLGGIAFGLAVFVAFGRMAVGVHYPSDIIGGLLVAAIAFLIVKRMHRAMWKGQNPV